VCRDDQRRIGGCAAPRQEARDVGARPRRLPGGDRHLDPPAADQLRGRKPRGEPVEVGIVPRSVGDTGEPLVQRHRHAGSREDGRQRRDHRTEDGRVVHREPRAAAGLPEQPISSRVVHYLDHAHGAATGERVGGGHIVAELASHQRHLPLEWRQLALPEEDVMGAPHVRQLAGESSQRRARAEVDDELLMMEEERVDAGSGDADPGGGGVDDGCE
jgi:hypothetical protein